jgi:hypothetical protein
MQAERSKKMVSIFALAAGRQLLATKSIEPTMQMKTLRKRVELKALPRLDRRV